MSLIIPYQHVIVINHTFLGFGRDTLQHRSKQIAPHCNSIVTTSYKHFTAII